MYGGEMSKMKKTAIGLGIGVIVVIIVLLVVLKPNTDEQKPNTDEQKPITWYKVDNYPEPSNHSLNDKLFSRDYNMTCPGNSYITQAKAHNGSFITNFGIKCSDNSSYSFNDTSYDKLGGGIRNFPEGVSSMRYVVGTPGGVKAVTGIFVPNDKGTAFQCPANTKIVGMKGKAGNYVGNLEFACR